MSYISLEDEITRRLPSILIDMDCKFIHLCTYKSLIIIEGHPEKPSEDDWNFLVSDIIEKEPWYKLKRLREIRDIELYGSDFMFISDYPHKSDESKQAWFD